MVRKKEKGNLQRTENSNDIVTAASEVKRQNYPFKILSEK